MADEETSIKEFDEAVEDAVRCCDTTSMRDRLARLRQLFVEAVRRNRDSSQDN